MVLGESHYCGDGCKVCGVASGRNCSDFTTDVVQSYLDQNVEREGWMSTYLKFERSLVNHETTPEERSAPSASTTLPSATAGTTGIGPSLRHR